MRRPLVIGALIAAAVAVVVLFSSRDGDDDAYFVRAIFDNAAYVVPGELVRVAGADVGTIEEVDVTRPGEPASYEGGQLRPAPGKGIIVLKIEDPSFQDFRRDASCHIRPQSLIGEKFVDCRPTLPRAPGTESPPPLWEVEDEDGQEQYLLPVESNTTSVDPDLINNINRLPYVQRFRLILNEFGAGLAGRGEDLEEAIKRANPALRDADRLLGILEAQRRELAQLAVDGDRILEPFARERTHVAGFFANAGAAGEASGERTPELEESFNKFPRFLREFRSTMRSLQTFSDAAAPVFADFGEAAPSWTEWTRLLTPFSAASTVALKSLGNAGEEAGPLLREAEPVARKTRQLGRTGASPTTKLAKFFASTKKTGGWDSLVDLIYNGAATTNAFDQYGHFTRSLVTLTNCVEYRGGGPQSGCVADFTGFGAGTSAVTSSSELYRLFMEAEEEQGGGTAAGEPSPRTPAPLAPARPATPAAPSGPRLGEGRELGASALPSPSQRALLDYLLAP